MGNIFFGIGKRVTILLPIFFYHHRDQSLSRLGLGRVVTPQGKSKNLCNLRRRHEAVIRQGKEEGEPF